MGVRRPVTPLWIPAFAGMTTEVGLERRLTETPPRRAPALDTGFRRYDGGGCDSRNGRLVVAGEVPLLRDGRFAKRPYGGVVGSWGG